MQLSVGTVVEGKVSKITNFGAFINIDGGGSGMVHISEVANTYVKDINEHLKVGDSVKAKVVAINENHKIALSIKALLPQQNRSRDGQRESRDSRGPRGNNTYVYQPPKPYTPATGDAFEDMMARFKRTSDDKMSDLSRVMDTRRGGNNRRSKK